MEQNREPRNKPACNAGDLGSIPGLGRSPGEGNGYPLQYCGLENSIDCIVHGVEKSWTRLNDFHFHFLVAQRVKNPPEMKDTQVPSLGREDPLEKAWQLTPVFLPGEFHGQRSLVGYSLWDCKESDTTEWLTHIYTPLKILDIIYKTNTSSF